LEVANPFFCARGRRTLASRSRHVPLTGSPYSPCGRDKRTPLCAVCARCAQRARVCSLGGLDVRQALERPAMLAPACRGHPIKAGAHDGHETGGTALRNTLWHVRVPAPVIDARVQLPALIRQCPRLERLLDRRTLAGGQVLSGLPLARPRGRVLGGGGSVRPYGHPMPAPPGRLPLPSGRIAAWSSPAIALRPDPCVTLWNVMPRREGATVVTAFDNPIPLPVQYSTGDDATSDFPVAGMPDRFSACHSCSVRRAASAGATPSGGLNHAHAVLHRSEPRWLHRDCG
jgi:hypothetical protein